ncbi:polyphosphate kinase 1 [Myxosarcina sp. GI1]|uniref:polyphosphate kinase 1 n=1 Tax=Myxosarcina sp. GI1 TaxID=1541065 RepID=UPI00056452F2|nr:polyphosphate kinase 1 [Myxosarcina sp. GI1]
MTTTKKSDKKIDLRNFKYYFNRELSWLEFNRRVLAEATDHRTPLLERLKFMSIVSSNLDEFFMVRVAGLKQQVEAGVTKLSADGRSAEEQLQAIAELLRPMIEEQHQHFEKVLKKELTKYGINLIDYVDLNQEQKAYLNSFFEEHIFPVLTPLAVDLSHPFPYISNLSLNLAIVLKDPSTDRELFARLKVPKSLPRFVALPKELRQRYRGKVGVWSGVPLEQIITHNLKYLFPGMNILESSVFRVTRNTDLALEEDEADDLLLAIEQELQKRRIGGSSVRLEIQAFIPENIRATIMRELILQEDDVYDIDGLIGLGDLMSFMSLPLPELKDKPWSSALPPRINWLEDENASLFDLIRKQDLLVHHPYHSFSGTVLRFITQAAQDPDVLAIKMTLYRTSGDSPIIKALISAAENGKQVVALVELKARFDEENNIIWARKLENSGVHVVYGLPGLKTHTKITLVVRQEEDKINRYMHIGTGNYNPKTAKIYTDLGLLTCDRDLGADLTDLFNFLTGYSQQKSYRKLLVAPVSLRDRMIDMIRREIEHCHNGKSGRIVAKMNALVDTQIIETLYEASQAGVKIDLIVRGICCLRPQLKGISDNINVVSVIGRFLEHSRIYYFQNDGSEEMYIGSADWMTRNLSRRVEAVTPIESLEIFKDLQEILGIMLSDNRQAWELRSDGTYIQRKPADGEEAHSTHELLMEMAAQLAELD